jgi:hypothetical protein
MKVTAGTFKLNNLVSMHNFSAGISTIDKTSFEDSIIYSVKDTSVFKIRKFHEKHIKPLNLIDTLA